MQLLHIGWLSSTANVSPSTGFWHRYTNKQTNKKNDKTINLLEFIRFDHNDLLIKNEWVCQTHNIIITACKHHANVVKKIN